MTEAADKSAAARQSWQWRAIAATRGTQTQIGTMLLAILGKSRQRPAFGPGCVISEDGFVFANYRDKNGLMHTAIQVCKVSEMNDAFRRLADQLKLDDADRIALFDEVRKWVYKDHRASTTLN